jgi:hypothetical protein
MNMMSLKDALTYQYFIVLFLCVVITVLAAVGALDLVSRQITSIIAAPKIFDGISTTL